MRKEAKPKKSGFKVTEARIAYKKKHLEPTKYQGNLLDFIRAEKEVPFNHTLGFNWTMLGGLLSRGICVWDRRPEGLVLKVI